MSKPSTVRGGASGYKYTLQEHRSYIRWTIDTGRRVKSGSAKNVKYAKNQLNRIERRYNKALAKQGV